ncbi:MAG: hypothetical protein AAF206_16655 [Bacteroidota bacterium]
MSRFRPYKTRFIAFRGLERLKNWQLKLYTISTQPQFSAYEAMQTILTQVPSMLRQAEDHYDLAFLIVHEGSDGVWSILNWWTGMEMLQTHTRFTPFDQADQFQTIPQSGSMACTWEHAVIAHEKDAWLRHILKQPQQPDFNAYRQDVLEGEL